jgi:hypothetical protein
MMTTTMLTGRRPLLKPARAIFFSNNKKTGSDLLKNARAGRHPAQVDNSRADDTPVLYRISCAHQRHFPYISLPLGDTKLV